MTAFRTETFETFLGLHVHPLGEAYGFRVGLAWALGPSVASRAGWGLTLQARFPQGLGGFLKAPPTQPLQG